MIALVQATFPDTAIAEEIGAALIEERLAACVNLLPCRSVYRWQEAVERGDEVVALFKTMPDRAPALATRLTTLHPYNLPAVEWWTTHGSAELQAWIVAAVS